MTLVGETLARHLASFGELPRLDREAVCRLGGEIRQVAKLADLLRAGERPNHVVLVLDGLLYRYTIQAEGARQIHSFYLANEAPCLETLYIDYMDSNLGAVVGSTVALIQHEALYRLIDAYPEARKLMWRQTLVQGAIFRAWLARNSKMPAQAALAHLICELFSRARVAGLAHDDSFYLPLTQEMIADSLGLTAVHLNRTLKVLRETGSVEWKGGRLTVLDWAKLQRLADYDPVYLHFRDGACMLAKETGPA